MIRMRPPGETLRLTTPSGNTLVVKKHLNAGEQRKVFDRMRKALPDGTFTVDPLMAGLSLMMEYLLDWDVVGHHGAVVPMAGLDEDLKRQALEDLDFEDFREIQTAIEAHDAAMIAARAQEKKPPVTAGVS